MLFRSYSNGFSVGNLERMIDIIKSKTKKWATKSKAKLNQNRSFFSLYKNACTRHNAHIWYWDWPNKLVRVFESSTALVRSLTMTCQDEMWCECTPIFTSPISMLSCHSNDLCYRIFCISDNRLAMKCGFKLPERKQRTGQKLQRKITSNDQLNRFIFVVAFAMKRSKHATSNAIR